MTVYTDNVVFAYSQLLLHVSDGTTQSQSQRSKPMTQAINQCTRAKYVFKVWIAEFFTNKLSVPISITHKWISSNTGMLVNITALQKPEMETWYIYYATHIILVPCSGSYNSRETFHNKIFQQHSQAVWNHLQTQNILAPYNEQHMRSMNSL